MRKSIWLIVAGAAALGCSGQKVVTLTSDNGKLALSYACTDSVPRALDGGAVELVRDVVVRETSEHIAEAPPRPHTRAVLEARARSDRKALERAVSSYVCAYGSPPTRPPRFPEAGSTPPDFVLTPLGETSRPGQPRLSSLRGRAVVLVFWSTWCTACREEYQELQKIAARAEAERISTYAILHTDTEAELRAWQREHGAGVPFLDDADERIARLYGVYGIPYTVVVRPDGRVQAAGHVSPGKLASVVAQALGHGSAPNAAGPTRTVPGNS